MPLKVIAPNAHSICRKDRKPRKIIFFPLQKISQTLPLTINDLFHLPQKLFLKSA
jgi:hypothetical protein